MTKNTLYENQYDSKCALLRTMSFWPSIDILLNFSFPDHLSPIHTFRAITPDILCPPKSNG